MSNGTGNVGTGTAAAAGTGTTNPYTVNMQRGEESSLSSWAGPYVTEMLGRGRALAGEDYWGYGGNLTAGESALQSQAYQGLGSLGVPQAFTTGSFTGSEYVPPTAQQALTGGTGSYTPASGNVVQQYMNPYLEAALQPQYDQAVQDYEIAQRDLQSRYGQAGAYGGGRQGAAEGVLGGEALRNMAAITGRGYEQAYANAQDQFTKDRQYGLGALKDLAGIGAEQRAIEAEGIAADIEQFEDERNDPYTKVQYMRSLLQGMPLETQAYEYYEPSGIEGLAAGFQTGEDILAAIRNIVNPGGGAATITLPAGVTQDQYDAMENLFNSGYINIGDWEYYKINGVLPIAGNT